MDLIFRSNPNLLSEFGVDHSLFDQCHHNIIFGKINIRLHLPPKYICELWDLKRHIQKIFKMLSGLSNRLEHLKNLQRTEKWIF